MKTKVILCTLAAAALTTVTALPGDACTNVIVTRGASADGSGLVSYAADSHWLYGELYFRPAADCVKYMIGILPVILEISMRSPIPTNGSAT